MRIVYIFELNRNVFYKKEGSDISMGKIYVEGATIQVLQIEEDDYISLTDMVRQHDNGSALIEKWLRNKNTIEFLGIWEEMYNRDFDIHAYDEIMQEAGLQSNGLKKLTQKVSLRKPGDMAAPMPIKILHLNLQAGYLRSSNYI